MLRRLGFDTANVAVSTCSGLLAIPRSLICSGLIWGAVATVTATIAARRQAAPISPARIFLVARRDITLDSPRLCSGLKREAMVKAPMEKELHRNSWRGAGFPFVNADPRESTDDTQYHNGRNLKD